VIQWGPASIVTPAVRPPGLPHCGGGIQLQAVTSSAMRVDRLGIGVAVTSSGMRVDRLGIGVAVTSSAMRVDRLGIGLAAGVAAH